MSPNYHPGARSYSRRAFLCTPLLFPILQRAPGGAVNALDEGLMRDGLTDDFPRFRDLVENNQGRSLYLPGGAKPYRFDITNQRPISFPTGIEVWGDANTTIELTTATQSFVRFANLWADSIRLHNLRITGRFAQHSRGWVFSFAGESGTLEDINIDLNNGSVGSMPLHRVSALHPSPTNSSAGWLFERLDIARAQRVWFRANNDKAEHNDIKFRDCTFRECFSDIFALNSPSSQINNASILDCRFEANSDFPTPTGILLGMTGSKRSVVRGCTFKGSCRDAIHIEQNTQDLVIEACSFDIVGTGVAVLDNDVGGTPASPRNILIHKNLIFGSKQKSGAPTGRGIHCVWDQSGRVAAESLTAVSNRIEGFHIGMDLGDVPSVIASHNTIQNCVFAIKALRPSLGTAFNTMRECEYGLSSRIPGSWGRQSFQDCRIPTFILP
jgi:hypothetical protein